MENNVYKPKDFAKMIGRSVITLQRWDREKILIAHRTTLTNRRFYTHDQYLSYLGIKADATKKILVYCRVSGSNQKNDLLSQQNALEVYCAANGYCIDEYITEIASGLNYQRKKFNQLLADIEMGRVSKLIIAHKDRLVRFGFEWFAAFAARHGTSIEIMNQESLSPQEEVTQDLLSIIHCFSSRLYGLRKYKKNLQEMLKEPEDAHHQAS